MKIADIESPYNGESPEIIKRNILYARIACRWALDHGFFPYASHLFFTQPGILDDKDPTERHLGIDAGKEIIAKSATHSLFFLDFGESSGMTYGRRLAEKAGREIQDIKLFKNFNPLHIAGWDYSELFLKAKGQGLIKVYNTDGWRGEI